MATVYSLVCFGGLSGKTVTFTDSGDVVNLTNHGLRQGVTGIVFSTTGSLPTGITAGTTYYPRDGVDANKFTIYPTKADALAGTNQITFTGTGSGTHTVKSAYMLGLSALQLARYGEIGSERVYSGIAAWLAARAADGVGTYDEEICEIGDAFTETISEPISVTLPCATLTITTMVNGLRSTGFHAGVVGNGFKLQTSTTWQNILNIAKDHVVVDGISVYLYNGGGKGVYVDTPYSFTTVKNCILYGRSGQSSIICADIKGLVTDFSNNLLLGGSSRGLYMGTYTSAKLSVISNNIIAKCGVGIEANTTVCIFYNNACVGNTDDYFGTIGSSAVAAYNAGPSGSDPFDTVGGTSVTSLTTSHFVDYANNDFRPTSDSPLVGAGVQVLFKDATDILGNVRPNYNPYGEEEWDIGCFEYDHGNGLAPETASLTITANVSLYGAEVRIYDLDTSDGTFGTELEGVESCTSATYVYEGLRGNEIALQIMQSGYEEYLQIVTLENATQSLSITLKADINA